MHAIATDPARNLILVQLAGMLSVEDTAVYITELRTRFRQDGFRTGYRILIDVEACTIQSQAMIEAMREHITTFPKAGRIAMVTGSSLARMQVRRVMTQSYAQVFATRDEALAWITAERAAA